MARRRRSIFLNPRRINHYFTLTRLAAHAPPPPRRCTGPREDYPTIASTPSAIAEKINELRWPGLSRIARCRCRRGSIRHTRRRWAQFRDGIVKPLLGEREVLLEADWRILWEKFDAFATARHMAVTKLGLKRVQEVLSHKTAAGKTRKRLSRLSLLGDGRVEPRPRIAVVNRLVLYHRDLFPFIE